MHTVWTSVRSGIFTFIFGIVIRTEQRKVATKLSYRYDKRLNTKLFGRVIGSTKIIIAERWKHPSKHFRVIKSIDEIRRFYWHIIVSRRSEFFFDFSPQDTFFVSHTLSRYNCQIFVSPRITRAISCSQYRRKKLYSSFLPNKHVYHVILRS